MLTIWILTTLVVASTGNPFQKGSPKCPPCQPEFCPKVEADCRHGVVVDSCGCCHVGVCLQRLGDRCLEPSSEISQTDLGKYGSCGQNMICRQRDDVEQERQTESTCKCLEGSAVCGSDNSTYSDICSLKEVNKVKLLHYGPCQSVPEIIGGPRDVIIEEGSSLALDCEVRGFPVPVVSWSFLPAEAVMG